MGQLDVRVRCCFYAKVLPTYELALVHHGRDDPFRAADATVEVVAAELLLLRDWWGRQV